MAQIRNKTSVTLWVPEIGKTVEPSELVTVPDERLEAFTTQTEIWADETVKSDGASASGSGKK